MAMRATPPEIDFSTFPESDGQPLDETSANALQMIDLMWTLQTLFDIQGRLGTTTVGGNQFVYYNPLNGHDNISPDVYVAFNRPPPAPPKWLTWIEGGFPDIVWEITSPSTRDIDLGVGRKGKRARYARLGAKEYYIYDPQQEMDLPFLGFALREGRMQPLPTLPGGGIYSPLLGAELRPVARGETERRPAGVWLRVIDPRSGDPIPIAEDERDDLLVTQGQLAVARDQLTEEARARLAAERRASEEARARLAAEERAARAEAELQALLADLGRRPDPHTDADADAGRD